MLRIFVLGVGVFCAMTFLYLYFGIQQNFFFHLWWWDILMHAIGGVLAGLIGIWWALFFGFRPRLIHCLIGATVLGIGVEVAEYALDLPRSPFMSYPLDVTKDLIVDCIGGAIAYLFVKRA